MTCPHLTVILLNWNTCERTLASLEALAAQDYPNITTLVVDNGSHDTSVERIRARFPELTLIALPENTGFAGGVNHALKYALRTPTDYVLLLNSDTMCGPQFVGAMITALEQRPDIGIASPKIYYQDRPSQLWGIGGAMQPHWMVVFGMDTPDDGRYDTQPLDFVFGCAMMIRREVIDTIGLLDERFFVYYEDVDYCLRSQAAGFPVALLPDIHIWHDGSHSTAKQQHWRTYLNICARMIFFHKYLHGAALGRFFLRESLYSASIIGRSLARLDLQTIGWYLRGLIRGIAHGRTLNLAIRHQPGSSL